MDRIEAKERLLRLPSHAFDSMLNDLGIDPAYLHSSTAPHATRVTELLRMLEARPNGLGEQFESALERAEKLPVAAASYSAVDGELDEIKGLLETQDYLLAKSLLARIERRHWIDLPASSRIRLLSQKGFIHLIQGDQVAAAKEYLHAVQIAPHEEKTRTDEALAYELIDDAPRAHALADKLIADFPLSPRPFAIWLRTSPADCSAESQEQLVASKRLPADLGEVWLAVAARAFAQQDFVRAERLADRAVKMDPDWPPGWLFLGFVIGRLVVQEGSRRPTRFSSEQQERLRLAASHFQKAADLAEKEKRIPIQIEALVGVARAHDLLENSKRAEDALRKANLLKPDEAHILLWLGGFLHEHGQTEEAVDLLEKSLRLEASSQTEFHLALALSGRKQDGDRVRATELFGHVARGKEGEFRTHALKFAVQGYLAVKAFDSVRRLLGEISEEAVSQILLQSFSGLVAFEAGDIEQAHAQADSALRAWTVACDDSLATESLARLLVRLDRYADALPMWQALVDPSMPAPAVDGLFACAQKLNRDDVLLDTCQRLRESGTASKTVRQLEFSLLERYEPSKAADLLADYVEENPEDHIARLMLCSCQLRTGRLDVATLNLTHLPSAKTLDPHQGEGVISLLIEHGRTQEAREYAYQLVRYHYNSMEAHRAFCSTFTQVPEETESADTSQDIVRPGVAVAFTPADRTEVEWIVIEDGPEPQLKLDEYAPSHRWCQDVLGKSIGDKIPVPGSDYPKQIATLTAIDSKYAYRLRDSFQQMTTAYADQTGWAKIHTPKLDDANLPPETKLKPLLDRLELAAQYELLAFERYRTYHLPIHVLGTLLGRSAFDATLSLIQRDGFGVICWAEKPTAEEAAGWLRKSPFEIVLDLTALATLFALDKLNVLESRETKFIVSQSTVEELRAVVRSGRPDPRQPGSMVSLGRGIRVVEHSVDATRDRYASRVRLLETVTTHCEIRSGRPLAHIQPSARSELCELFGQHGAESLVLARDGNCLLWTDDAMVAVYGKHEMGIRRVWTQVVLGAPLAALDEKSRIETTAKLVGWGFQKTSFDFAVIRYAGEVSGWQPQTFPLKQVIDALVAASNTLEACIQAVRGLILETERAVIVNSSAQATYRTILAQLRDRPGGTSAVKKMLAELPLNIRAGMNLAGYLALDDER